MENARGLFLARLFRAQGLFQNSNRKSPSLFISQHISDRKVKIYISMLLQHQMPPTYLKLLTSLRVSIGFLPLCNTCGQFLVCARVVEGDMDGDVE